MNSEEDYPFEEFEKAEEKKKKKPVPEFNPACRCPEFKCPRHSNCKACQEYHRKNYDTTYCGK